MMFVGADEVAAAVVLPLDTEAYWTSDAGVVTSGANITSWTDQIGGNVLVPIAAGVVGLTGTSQNGIGVVDATGDASTDTSFATGIWTNRAATIIFAIKIAGGTGGTSQGVLTICPTARASALQDHQGILVERLTAGSFQTTVGTFQAFASGASLLTKNAGAVDTAWRVITVRVSTSAMTIRWNGIDKVLTTSNSMPLSNFAGGTPGSMVIRLNGRIHSVGALPSDSYFAAVATIPRYISDVEAAAAETSLMAKWGIV